MCELRVRALQDAQVCPFQEGRTAVLGRALGEPMFFPVLPSRDLQTGAQKVAVDGFNKDRSGVRVGRWLGRYRQESGLLRALFLPSGYVFSEDAHDAIAMVRELRLVDLFEHEAIWLQRGERMLGLARQGSGKGAAYRYIDGPDQGLEANLLFGDRYATSLDGLKHPMHRDLRAFVEREGFERVRPMRCDADAVLAQVRAAGRFWTVVLDSEGASLKLGCVHESKEHRVALQAWQQTQKIRLLALEKMRETALQQVRERPPFDRPRDVEDHFDDGTLRPAWWDAYRRGQAAFVHEGNHYQVFDPGGKPWPPQVCVNLVLENFERTAGTWYRERGEKPERVKGLFDFNDYGIKNRSGVLAFGDFAAEHPELFHFVRLPDSERIAFADRARFFGALEQRADDFQPGDVVAIHGLKKDGYVHQHAMLVLYSDPVTGVPIGLFDQMSRPRIRTWEMVMAEAPKRSILYRARPTQHVWDRLSKAAEVVPAVDR